MRCTFLENCGLLLSCEFSSILVDAPNGRIDGFDTTSEGTLFAMASAEPPYNTLCGLFFTHLHPDHFDQNRLAMVLEKHKNAVVFLPRAEDAPNGTLTAGEFTVHYFSLPHSGGSTYATEHRVLLVECGGKSVYICGDGEPQNELHYKILEEYHPQVAIWNPNYVNFSRGRELLKLVQRNYICHLPIVSHDALGIKRKCMSSFEKFSDELLNVTCVLEHNFTAQI